MGVSLLFGVTRLSHPTANRLFSAPLGKGVPYLIHLVAGRFGLSSSVKLALAARYERCLVRRTILARVVVSFDETRFSPGWYRFLSKEKVFPSHSYFIGALRHSAPLSRSIRSKCQGLSRLPDLAHDLLRKRCSSRPLCGAVSRRSAFSHRLVRGALLILPSDVRTAVFPVHDGPPLVQRRIPLSLCFRETCCCSVS